jgi:hypothetical protein
MGCYEGGNDVFTNQQTTAEFVLSVQVFQTNRSNCGLCKMNITKKRKSTLNVPSSFVLYMYI